MAEQRGRGGANRKGSEGGRAAAQAARGNGFAGDRRPGNPAGGRAIAPYDGSSRDRSAFTAGGDYSPGRQWARVRDARDFSGEVRPAWSPLISGCPPFAQRNGCLSPTEARAIWGYSEPYDNWYTYPYWYSYGDRSDWRYYDGYLYRMDPATLLIVAFLPLLGGALYEGNPWPDYYDSYVVDSYYGNYYGYSEADYDYRYGDGAIFAVDRDSRRIEAVVALLTGDHWTVGEAMPDGYDCYNVPPDYRDRYFDREDAWYRYSDGYIYEVDPATLVVRTSIELVVPA